MSYKGYATQLVVQPATGHLTGFVSDDFYSLIQLLICLIPEVNDASYKVTTIIMAGDSGTISSAGEAYDAHDSSPGHDYVLVDLLADKHYMLDITDQDPGMSAGDMLGVSFASSDAGNEVVHLTGLRIKYRRKYPLMAGLSAIAEDFWPCEKSDFG